MLDAATTIVPPAAIGIFCVLVALMWRRLVGLAGAFRASLLARRRRRASSSSSSSSTSTSSSWEFPIPAHLAISRRRPLVVGSSYADPRGVMNLRPLRDDHSGMWLDVDRNYLEQIELKSVYLRTPALRPSVFGIHPPLASIAHVASAEVLDLVASRLERDYPGLVDRRGDVLTNVATGRYWHLSSSSSDDDDGDLVHPLCIAAQLVQEDLAIMLPSCEMGGGRGGYVLGAAAICFADQWRLTDKIGRDLAGIHAPVERYPQIDRSTSAFFRGLQPGGERVRYTHSFCERPDLHIETEPRGSDCPVPATGLPHSIYVRSERQVLARLPRSGGVLFTIRTYRVGLDDVPESSRGALLASLETASNATPLSNLNKELFGERVRSRFGA